MRAPWERAGEEEALCVSQRNKEKRVRRLIKANFKEGDLWTTLKYPKGTRKSIDEVRKDLNSFLRSLRTRYKSIDEIVKYIYRIEVGALGGVHIHILINRVTGADKIITKCWERFGHVNYQNIYETGGYADLAEYIVKQPEENTEEYEQLNMFSVQEQKELVKYSCSRNLVRPEPERTDYSRRTMRKIIENGPEPTPGYFIDPLSVVMGTNPYTGMNYLHYTEYKLLRQDDP